MHAVCAVPYFHFNRMAREAKAQHATARKKIAADRAKSLCETFERANDSYQNADYRNFFKVTKIFDSQRHSGSMFALINSQEKFCTKYDDIQKTVFDFFSSKFATDICFIFGMGRQRDRIYVMYYIDVHECMV